MTEINSPERKYAGRNHCLAALFIEELFRSGVRQLVISPGSRSTPLVVAAIEHPHLSCYPHPDERGAAFFGLGCSKATEQPTALICTSGSAVGHYLPAVMEAYHSQIPLIILSADRPNELRQTGANQTTQQPGLFSNHLVAEFNLPPPDSEESLISAIQIANYSCFKSRLGPVHVNFEFRKPLLDSQHTEIKLPENIKAWSQSRRAWISYSSAPQVTKSCASLQPNFENELIELFSKSERGLILVGPLYSQKERLATEELARELDWPMLAEITSGLSLSPQSNIFSNFAGAEKLFRSDPSLTPDAIIHIGGTPTCEKLLHTLKINKDKSSPTCWHISTLPTQSTLTGLTTHRFFGDTEQFLCAIMSFKKQALIAPSKLLSKLTEIADPVRNLPCGVDPRPEQVIVDTVLESAPLNSLIYLANSLTVRVADSATLTKNHKLEIGCHRGLSGIDGTIAIACGMALNRSERTYLLCGDMAFFHDLNSLRFLGHLKLGLTIIVIENRGGRIFDTLPNLKSLSYYGEYFEMHTPLDYKAIVTAFGVDCVVLQHTEELGMHLDPNGETQTSSSQVIVVSTPG